MGCRVFVSTVPLGSLQQLAALARFEDRDAAYVCASGAFRVEQALHQVASASGRELGLHGSDVALVTVAAGRLAAGEMPAFRFHGALSAFEERLAGATPTERVAGLLLASQAARYAGKGESARLHREHLDAGFATYLAAACEKLDALMAVVPMTSFVGRDFVEHGRAGLEAGAVVVGFPLAASSSGFTNVDKFLDANVEWDRPAVTPITRDRVVAWIDELAASGGRYIVGTEHAVPGLKPAASLYAARGRTVNIYAKTDRSSLIRRPSTVAPFWYRPVERAELTATTRVTIARVDAARMRFLTEQYLPDAGAQVGLLNFLVHLDDKLAGGFTYARSPSDPASSVMLTSDFAIVDDPDVADLVLALAVSREPVRVAGARLLAELDTVTATARGSSPRLERRFGFLSRDDDDEGIATYATHVHEEDPADVYARWWSALPAHAPAAGGDAPARDAPRPPEAS